jgi:hypothetical protein
MHLQMPISPGAEMPGNAMVYQIRPLFHLLVTSRLLAEPNLWDLLLPSTRLQE